MNKYAKLIIACIGLIIVLMLFFSCDKSCYQCNVEHQFYKVDSLTDRRYWDNSKIDSSFIVCGYDADAYSGKIVDINPGVERTYNHCIKK